MRIEVVGQPDASSSNLLEFMRWTLADNRITEFVAVTAWANHRGLARVVPELRSLRSRHPPGHATIVLGIDEGGATEQGLRLAAAEFDHSYVLSTSDERTFHPKVYLGMGPAHARLFVGSNNLTPGGLFYNFEAGLAIEVDFGAGDLTGEQLIADTQRLVRRLIADTNICKPLTAHVDAIIADPRYRIRDEATPRKPRGTRPADPDADSDSTEASPLFTISSVPARPRVPPGAPLPLATGLAPIAPATAGRRRPGGRTVRVSRPARGAAAPPPAPVVIHRWSRAMDATAAQQPPPGSNPTGNIRLTQAGHGLDQTTYFRNELFATAAWASTAEARGTKETATVPMEVVVDGRRLGVMDFEISHAAWREAGQGNVPTVLHVGPIADTLRAADYRERVLSIEQFAGGAYRLTIDTTETGPFVR